MFGNLSAFDSSLFDQFRQMQQEIDQLFGDGSRPNSIRAVSRGSYPPMNVGGTPDHVDVYLFAAGMEGKDLDISIQRNLLTVAGERKPSEGEAANYYRRERFTGAFRRVVTLPEDVDPDQVQASYRNGVLHITIQRRESAKRKRIEVQ